MGTNGRFEEAPWVKRGVQGGTAGEKGSLRKISFIFYKCTYINKIIGQCVCAYE